jgi:multiple sugar transport system ATP-binding protein
LRGYEGRTVILGIRPEDLEEASLEPDSPSDRRLRGVVELREALGSELMVHFTVEGTREALTEDVKELAQDAGAPESAALESKGSGALLVGRFGARATVEVGQPVEVAVDTRSLHFFDAETSEGIYDGDTSEKGASA